MQGIEETLLPLFGVKGFSLYSALASTLTLQAEALRSGALWTPLTYAWIHASPLHLLLNLFGLWITGRSLERLLGRNAMVSILLLGSVAGAIGFLVSLGLDPRLSGELRCMGASAVVTACIGVATALAPRERITLWILFVPIPLKAGGLLPVLLGLFAVEAVAFAQTTAYGAHLGGFLMGLLLAKILK